MEVPKSIRGLIALREKEKVKREAIKIEEMTRKNMKEWVKRQEESKFKKFVRRWIIWKA